jgi:protein-glutamine gamma-glutamyltransferase
VRFQAAHKLVTYLLVLSALGALATTRALSPASGIVFVAVAALSYLVDAGGKAAVAIDRGARLVRGATGTLLAVIVWRIWRRMPDADLAPAFDLILALLAYKLLFRRSHRDYVQIYALTFLLVLVASTVTATFLFVAAFAVYVVLATWALILFHLRREMEENYLVRHSAQAPSQKVGIGRILGSRRVVGRAFFGATFLVAAGVFIGAVTVFAAVPRLGAGFVLGGHAPSTVLGLTDEVTIGRYGTAATARHDVVLRAVIPRISDLADPDAQRAAVEQLYFRGAVYDTYDGGRWIRSRRPELRTVLSEIGARAYVGEAASPPAGPAALDGAERQEIEAIGVPATALLALDRPVAFELPAGRLGVAGAMRVAPRWSGETALRIGGDSADALVTLAHAHYTAYSRSATPSPGLLDERARLANLELPDDLRDVKVLGARLGGAEAVAARVSAITGWLRAGHGYTTTPPPPPRGVDPVSNFLFAERQGHCEYFASAAVLLLRAAGIPARYVTGFRGGEWNTLGHYVAVRGDRAHAWAEAFVPGTGWMRVDPTPPGAPAAPPGRLAQVGDALDFLWSRWIVGYDLGRQRALLHRAWRAFAGLGPGGALARTGLAAALLVGIGLLVVAGSRLRRGWRSRSRLPGSRPTIIVSRHRPREGGPVERLYSRTTDRLRHRGWARHPHETPHEYATRLRTSGVLPEGGPFQALTDRYTAARFGDHAPDPEAVAALGQSVAAALSRVPQHR